jgi:hypothetical protein
VLVPVFYKPIELVLLLIGCNERFSSLPQDSFSLWISFFAFDFKIQNAFSEVFCLEYKLQNVFSEVFDKFELKKLR